MAMRIQICLHSKPRGEEGLTYPFLYWFVTVYLFFIFNLTPNDPLSLLLQQQQQQQQQQKFGEIINF